MIYYSVKSQEQRERREAKEKNVGGNKENGKREDKNKWNLFIYSNIFNTCYNVVCRKGIKMKENSITTKCVCVYVCERERERDRHHKRA